MFWLVDGVNRPHKVTHLLRTVFTPSWFFELEQSGGRDSLDLLTKVKYKEQGGEEDEWRVLESVVNYWLLAIYNQIFKATDHLLRAPLDLTPYTLHLTFSYFEPGGKWGKKSEGVSKLPI